MNKPRIRVKPGEALVDVLATFPELDWLQREFDMLYFLDFCCGLDSSVIQEKLLFTGPIKPFSSEVNPVVEALIENEVLQKLEVTSDDPMKLSSQILAGLSSREIRSRLPDWFPANEIQLYSTMTTHGIDLSVQVGLEEWLEIPTVLWAHATPLYLWLPKVRWERRALQKLRGTLANQYDELSQEWGEARRKADPNDTVQLPPIALEILSKANKTTDLPAVALEVRDQYRNVRQRFAELDECLASKDVSPQKKLKERDSIEKSFAGLYKTTKADVVSLLGSVLGSLLEFVRLEGIPTVGEDPQGAIDWPRFGERVAEWLASGVRYVRMRPLYATRKCYLDTPSKAMYDAVRRHFGHELTREDLELARRYAALLERIRRPAEP